MTRRLPYRTRLTIAYTAVVAIAAVLLGAVAFVTARAALGTALDTRLHTTAQAIRSVVDVRHGRLGRLDREDREQFQAILGEGVNGAVLRADGSLLASNLAAPPRAILAAVARPGALKGSVKLRRTSVAFAALPIEEEGVRYGTVAAWEPLSAYDDAARLTLIALGIAGLVAIVAAAAVSDRLLGRLETAFERERRFIADASHELRTPVSVMRAEVELALMHERSPDDYRSTLQRLQSETRRLETLAQSLLLTARNDAGVAAAAPVAARGVAHAAVDRMQPLARSRDVALTCSGECDADVVVDPALLEGALVALIDNALRFAPPGGTVDVAARTSGADALLVVSDNGPGFSEAALRDATLRFWRDEPARSGAGSGLGLAIVRALAERHGGTIVLRNAANGPGAVVELRLPAIHPSRA
jgi:signal transduction histidine kinase